MTTDQATPAPPVDHRILRGDGIDLAADVSGDPAGLPVLLLHGGGQTRHSWSAAMRGLASRGHYVVSVDLRGHGDSGWSHDGDYQMTTIRNDVLALAAQLPARPVLVGASLGGIASLLAVGESEERIAQALVLVDITPRIEMSGVKRIQHFMRAKPEGFETLDEAADAVAAYNPQRPRPRDPTGLLKNLRQRDGRYFWHWDPAFLDDSEVLRPGYFERLDRAAAAVSVPTLLVRGAESELVSKETVKQMLDLIPHSEFVDIAGAGHMVAGDRNDSFNSAIFEFLEKLSEA